MPSPEQQPQPRPGMPAVAACAVVLWALALVLAGCLPAAGTASAPAAMALATPAEPETATVARTDGEAWRELYRQNRPVPPATFRLPPKMPRENTFAEFDEARYQGLDRQPDLPALPGDDPGGRSAAGGARPPAGRSGALTAASRPVPPTPAAGEATPGWASPPLPDAPFGTERPAPRPAGVRAGGRFHPMEQLVYGGGYPDLDRPEAYRLMPKDIITVTVRDHPEFSAELTIQPDGTVRIPNAPDLVRLRGRTVEEAAGAIQETLQPYVRGECLVRVQANRARGGYYYVFGDVLQPGRFPMGLEPIRLSEAVLAANWEANPARRDADGDDLGPSFPAATPRGRFVAPPTADLTGVMLITPHRSQPVRTRHDVRAALLGLTAGDPLVRPGQIVVVPSLVAEKNRQLGLETIPAPVPVPIHTNIDPAPGFSTGSSPARLPEVDPVPAVVAVPRADLWTVPAVEANMADAYEANRNGATAGFPPVIYARSYDEAAALTGSPFFPSAATAATPVDESLTDRAPPGSWPGGR
ncbi:MAG: polysaccharide biosynthesis/export family protein [Planctomycetes bacterium]|nr:polysaccharide biosynthesis/export family protein [Planctomycetota bacterium]